MVDKIEFLGVSWHLLSLTVYLLSVWFITGTLKARFKPKTWQKKVLLSWAVGLVVFFTIGLLRPDQVTFQGIVQYFFITLMLNGAYKGSTLLWDFLAAKFTFIPPRKKRKK
jgi:predicted membrane protein